MTVLGIDPGTRKVGIAVVDAGGNAIEIAIEPLGEVEIRVQALIGRYAIDAIAMGKGTNAGVLAEKLGNLGVPIGFVDERETTLKARSLYFADHPPRGWRRLVPLGMQLPPRPVDDYAAVLIARRYLEGTVPGRV
jgi:RNase H-fold protein (predicted Holliday junction resolvase)